MICAPPQFAAPEIQLGNIFAPACDVRSLGCLIYTLFSYSNMLIPDIGYRDTLLNIAIRFG